MKLYGDIDYHKECNHLLWIGETNNFSTIWQSMKLLFQVTTGNPLPLMIEDLKHEAALPFTIIPFIFIFFVISNFVLLNVFIALLLENFEYNLEGEFAIGEVDVEFFKVRQTTLNPPPVALWFRITVGIAWYGIHVALRD